jgi:hypothetical protein
MPRLVGKKSNPALYAGFGLLAISIAAVGLEYFGVIDFAPNFGKDNRVNNTYINQPSRIK